MNIYLSPISSVLTGFILVLGFIHYLVLIEFYYKNKEVINNPELIDEKEKLEQEYEKAKLMLKNELIKNEIYKIMVENDQVIPKIKYEIPSEVLPEERKENNYIQGILKGCYDK